MQAGSTAVCRARRPPRRAGPIRARGSLVGAELEADFTVLCRASAEDGEYVGPSGVEPFAVVVQEGDLDEEVSGPRR